MAGEGFALAREELVRTLTAYSGVTTADGSASKKNLIDNALIGKNDFLTGKSILIMSGDAQYETAGISDFDDDTGEITFATALSAQIVAGVSFRVLNVLPESIHIKGYDYESGEWRKVRVTGSGEIAIAITVADIVTAKISGQSVVVTSGQVVAKVSGQSVVVTSGQVVGKVSGETVIGKVSGEVVKISGETVSIETPTSIKTGPIQVITAASGGQILYSGAIKSVVVKALTNNSGVIMVGGSGDRPWYEAVCSGQGLILAGAEAVSLDASDFNEVYVVAEVSGEQVSFLGVN